MVFSPSSASSCSPSPATSTSSHTMSTSSPVLHANPALQHQPVITSFAMKSESVSPGPSGSGDLPGTFPAPLDLDTMAGQLSDCAGVLYAAYRTASKLEVLRHGLRMDLVKLGTVASVFQQHGLGMASHLMSTPGVMSRKSPHVTCVGGRQRITHHHRHQSNLQPDKIDRGKASDIVTDIFFAAGKV